MTTLARVVLLLGAISTAPLFAAEESVAIAIVYDTSGSMAEKVRGAGGQTEAKYTIASRALDRIVARLEKFTADTGTKLQVGLFVFSKQSAEAAVPIGPFQPAKLRDWLKDFAKPEGGTPLGNASAEAARALLATKAASRHVLVLTDGQNTLGPPPERTIKDAIDKALKDGNSLFFHFIAFDVNARVFDAIKKQGATVLSASDEKELNDRLSFVLEEKILLEKE